MRQPKAQPDWTLPLAKPVTLPDGRVLSTLGDLGRYISKLPEKEAKAQEWQFAIAEMLTAAHRKGPVLHAMVAFCRALKLPDPPRRKKAVKKYRIIE